jgi:hypothetical protein
VAVDAFMALPPGLQSVVVAALAVNKLGGGIVSSGIKDLLGLALGSLKTITAANVTVVGANVVGGGVPGAAGGWRGRRRRQGRGQVRPADRRRGRDRQRHPRGVRTYAARQRGPTDSHGQFGPRSPGQSTRPEDRRRPRRGACCGGVRRRLLRRGGEDQGRRERHGGRSDPSRQGGQRCLPPARRRPGDAREGARQDEPGRVPRAGTKAAQIAAANYLANRFAHSNAPFYRSTANAAKTLRALEALQVRFHKQTGHDNAQLARDILLVRSAINAAKTTAAHKADQVKVETTKSGQRVALAVRKKNLAVTVNDGLHREHRHRRAAVQHRAHPSSNYSGRALDGRHDRRFLAHPDPDRRPAQPHLDPARGLRWRGGSGSYPIDDSAGTHDFNGDREFVVTENGSYLVDGFLTDQTRERGSNQPHRTARPSTPSSTRTPCCTASGSTDPRGAETDVARVLAFAAADLPTFDTTWVLNSNTSSMTAKKYDTGEGWTDLITDTKELTGKTLFVHDKATGAGVSTTTA